MSSSYALLKNTGCYIQLSKTNPPNTVIVPQYGAISYSTLQQGLEGQSHRTFKNAYPDISNGECGRYYQRAIMY